MCVRLGAVGPHILAPPSLNRRMRERERESRGRVRPPGGPRDHMIKSVDRYQHPVSVDVHAFFFEKLFLAA